MDLADDALRRRALDALGHFGDALARAALEHGQVFLRPASMTWEGSFGTMQGHVVVLRTGRAMHDRLSSAEVEAYVARDALHVAIAAALAERAGHALVALELEAGEVGRTGGGPYRT